MVPPSILIVFFAVFFFVTWTAVIRRGDDLFAIFYLFLFVYTIFTQIGYIYFPELAMTNFAYFGSEIFYDYWLFVFLSFVGVFLLRMLFRPHPAAFSGFTIVQSKGHGRLWLFYIGVFGFLLWTVVNYVSLYDEISYGSMGGSQIFSWAVSFLPIVFLTLYSRLRHDVLTRAETVLCVITSLAVVVLLFNIEVHAADRTILSGLFIGILLFEAQPIRSLLTELDRGKLAVILLIGMLFLVYSTAIRIARQSYNEISLTEFWNSLKQTDLETHLDLSNLVSQDYFQPSLLLLASMNYQAVDLLEVVRANVFNSLMFLNYPTLGETVGKIILPSVTRSSGYAFYLLCEGYNALGWWGILWNAIMINLGMVFCEFFVRSNNKRFSIYMRSVISTVLLILVRSQSSYYIKFSYFYFLPALVLLYLSSGLRPVWSRKKKCSQERSRTR